MHMLFQFSIAVPEQLLWHAAVFCLQCEGHMLNTRRHKDSDKPNANINPKT